MLVMFSHVRCGNTAKDLSTVGGGRLSGAEMRHYCRHSVCKTRVTSGLCFELGGKRCPEIRNGSNFYRYIGKKKERRVLLLHYSKKRLLATLQFN